MKVISSWKVISSPIAQRDTRFFKIDSGPFISARRARAKAKSPTCWVAPSSLWPSGGRRTNEKSHDPGVSTKLGKKRKMVSNLELVCLIFFEGDEP